jgi:hypothetical protein
MTPEKAAAGFKKNHLVQKNIHGRGMTEIRIRLMICHSASRVEIPGHRGVLCAGPDCDGQKTAGSTDCRFILPQAFLPGNRRFWMNSGQKRNTIGTPHDAMLSGA